MLAGARISDEELQTTMMIWHEADSESSARGVEDGVCPLCPLSHHGTWRLNTWCGCLVRRLLTHLV